MIHLPSTNAPTAQVAGLSAAAAAAVSRVPLAAILTPARGAAPIARARQLAIYLQHVGLGASLTACARLFRRDRATVRHACATIENLRDDVAFDLAARHLERALMAQRDMVLALLRGSEAGR